MKVLITQSNYIPWKGYFDSINIVDTFVIYDDVQFTKRDWRNRNRISTSQGVQWITIPVKVKGKFNQKIRDVRISSADWAQKHWKTIEHSYRKTQFFTEVSEVLKPIYLGLETMYLSEVNYCLIKAIADYLGIKTKMIFSSEFDFDGDKNEKLIRICKSLNALHYFTGPSAKSYIDEKQFSQNNLSVNWLDYQDYPEYKQRSVHFDHNVSIIDLLFNTGTNAKKFMKTFN